MSLEAAHKGYDYQDLISAGRIVDVLLGIATEVYVDEKFHDGDVFDDLTIVQASGARERVQIKHTSAKDRPLSLATFTSDARSLRLDNVFSSILRDRESVDSEFSSQLYRIVFCDAAPTDKRLADYLKTPKEDPGPVVPGMKSIRFVIDSNVLWTSLERSPATPEDEGPEPVFKALLQDSFGNEDVRWICDRLVIEVQAPEFSADLSRPKDAELLLINRALTDIGAETYPNQDRSAIDVSSAIVSTVRAARQGQSNVDTESLVRRARLRTDFGSVEPLNPVDHEVEVLRDDAVKGLVSAIEREAQLGGIFLITGPPGQGKSWLCQQVLDRLDELGWLTAEHYCYLGDADGHREERVLAERIFGSLMARLAESDPSLGDSQRPRFAADEEALVASVNRSLQSRPDRPVALVVDGLDHVTRVQEGQFGAFDPSRAVAEALALLELPAGSICVVLSQPGSHLEPLQDVKIGGAEAPELGPAEVRALAARLGIVPIEGPGNGGKPPLLSDEEDVEDFVQALSSWSKGNALYATYLCREAAREESVLADPGSVFESFPTFDGTLESYYRRLTDSLGNEGEWVADVIALVDFPISRAELREIRPTMSAYVNGAAEVLGPVLRESVGQGGLRLYHESFGRYLRNAFQEKSGNLKQLFQELATWLKSLGFFEDTRSFKSLIPVLADAGEFADVLGLVHVDFVRDAVAAGHPAATIKSNLATAVMAAGATEAWPQVAKCVELARAAETYQDERFDSTLVRFADVPGGLLGPDLMAERLLDDGIPVMPARAGLQMCARLDELGAARVPWREYLDRFAVEVESDHTIYGQESDELVSLAWVRGRLRLASGSNTPQNLGLAGIDFSSPLSVEELAEKAEKDEWAPKGLARVVMDIGGLPLAESLVANMTSPGETCLEVAQYLASPPVGQSDEPASAAWVHRALEAGLPYGRLRDALELGLQIDDLPKCELDSAVEKLLALTEVVRSGEARFEPAQIDEWLDLSVIAANRHPMTLDAIEATLAGEGWYLCWLRFVLGLARAEVLAPEQQSRATFKALLFLEAETDPFLGDPRACDLYPFHGQISSTIRRALRLIDDELWSDSIELLHRVSKEITTSLMGEMGGPVAPDLVLDLIIETTTSSRLADAKRLVAEQISDEGGRFYVDLAEYRLHAARLEMAGGDIESANDQWSEACLFLTAYGWHKDITIYELLDPLPVLIASNPAMGRRMVSSVQSLCTRVFSHTDGKETRGAIPTWWRILAQADPAALTSLVSSRLLKETNEPNSWLVQARDDLWVEQQHLADPWIAGILRVSMEAPLHKLDPVLLERLAGEEVEPQSRELLLTLLLARADERPFTSPYSNGSEYLLRDDAVVDQLNEVARKFNLPSITNLRKLAIEQDVEPPTPKTTIGSDDSRPVDVTVQSFPPGLAGIARAISALRNRPIEHGRSFDRIENAIGYRMLALAQEGRERELGTTLVSLADVLRFDHKSSVLKNLASGLSRAGFDSLASIANTLAWTNARGGGGWLNFGGEEELEALAEASRQNQSVAAATLISEVRRMISTGRYGTNGITEALIFACESGALGSNPEVACDIWDEAFTVIDRRAPSIEPWDALEDSYEAPAEDPGSKILGNLDAAFAIAAAAGFSHPSREMKRRSLLAFKLLIHEKPELATEPLKILLREMRDPAGLTWVLSLVDRHRDEIPETITEIQPDLAEISKSPLLTVRALARRLQEEPEPRMTTPEYPDIEPTRSQTREPRSRDPRKVIGLTAGNRLSQAEPILPGLTRDVIQRASLDLETPSFDTKLKAQTRAFADQTRQHWPDAYLATEETIERAIQNSAGLGRDSMFKQGSPVVDPLAWEDDLANALLDDPELPLDIESIRVPRPNIPAPLDLEDVLWDGFETSDPSRQFTSGTLSSLGTSDFPVFGSGSLSSWILLSSAEEMTSRMKESRESKSVRYRSALYLRNESWEYLDVPPVAEIDIDCWAVEFEEDPEGLAQSQPLSAQDRKLASAGDSPSGLGIPTPLLVPVPGLTATLGLAPHGRFSLRDDLGDALRLVTWRALYETSDYYLTYARICGSALILRPDLFECLLETLGSGRVLLRDFVVRALADTVPE